MKIMKIPSTKNQTNTNDQNSKLKSSTMIVIFLSDRNVKVIGISDLDIIWNLGFVNWNFGSFSEKQIFFYESIRIYFDITLHAPAPCLTPAMWVPKLSQFKDASNHNRICSGRF